MELLEREPQLASLAEYAEEARSGAGRLVFVSGEAGVGKSALLERFTAEVQGARIGWGLCDGLFRLRPLAPLIDLAQSFGGRLLELVESNAPRDELFSAVLAELTSSPRLTVLIIEDVHWADEATLDLLRFLGRRLRSAQALLVATFRTEGLAASHPMRIMLGELSTLGQTRRMNIPRLSPAGVEVLADHSPLGVDELYRLTGGNPFFVTEVVRAGSAELPTSVRDAVLARIAGLTPTARECLEVAALCGLRVRPELIEALVPDPSAWLDELVESGTLVEEDGGLRFRHELTRVTVEEQVPAHRRRDIHVGLLAALERSPGSEPARLARHAEGAEDGAAVLRYAPAAGRRAAELGSHREAAEQYERALRFAAADADRAALCAQFAIELSLTDRWEDAAVQAEVALALARRLGSTVDEADLLIFLSTVMWRLCRQPESADYAARAVAAAQDIGGPLLARAMAGLARSDYHDDAPELAASHAAAAVALAASLDLCDVQSDALNTQACALARLGQDWEPLLRRSLEIAVTGGADAPAGRAFANLQAMLLDERRLAEAEATYREGSVYCEEHDIATYGTCLSGAQSQLLMLRGEWDASLRLVGRLLSVGDVSPANRILPGAVLGRILARCGRTDEAVSHLDAVLGLVSSMESGWLLEVLPARVESRWLAGDDDGARTELRVAAAHLENAHAWGAAELRSWATRLGVELVAGGPALPEPYRLAAEGDWDAAAAAWDRLGCPYDAALALYDSDDETHLREALDRLARLGASATGALVRRRMRALGIRSIPAGARRETRKHPLGLTPRQQEILALLGEGHSNRQIADRLFISAKTVDHHVSAVLDKLGVASRGQAAAAARESSTSSVQNMGRVQVEGGAFSRSG